MKAAANNQIQPLLLQQRHGSVDDGRVVLAIGIHHHCQFTAGRKQPIADGAGQAGAITAQQQVYSGILAAETSHHLGRAIG